MSVFSPVIRAVRNTSAEVFAWLLVLLALLSSATAQAQTCAAAGKDGPCTVNTVAAVLNSYHAGVGTAAAGANQVQVAAVAGQRSVTRSIQAGDLVLIMQMQDSTTPANAGLHEYAMVTAVGGTTLSLNRPLTNTYVQSVSNAPTVRTFQVIYVPQCSNFTVNAGASLRADRWIINVANGQGTGGVVAIDSANSAAINGTITVAGMGFRGGAGRNGGDNRAGGLFSDASYNYAAATVNGSLKGEGVAGVPSVVLSGSSVTFPGFPAASDYFALTGQGYTAGAMGQAQIQNAGGGGNDSQPASSGNQYNSGGGGGGNAGAGGRGGNTWNNNDNADAALNSPTSAANSGLGGNPAGGLGGNALTNADTRLLLGGGGGAGSSNNATGPINFTSYPPFATTTTINGAGTNTLASSGATGGGIVMIRSRTFSAAGGFIDASGFRAYNVGSGNTVGASTDGAGGGGAGGSVLLLASSGSGAGLTVVATGGAGGSTGYFNHGPGGGGAGGYVNTSFTGVTTNVTGGANGVDGFSVAGNLSPKAYNSTAGNNGQVLTTGGTAAGSNSGGVCRPELTVQKSTTTPILVLPGQTTATFAISVSNSATAAAAYGVGIGDVLPVPLGLLTVASVGTTTFAGTGTTGPSPTTPNRSGNTPTVAFGQSGSGNNPTTPSFTIFPGGSVTISFVVRVNTSTTATFQNGATVTFTDPTRSTGGPASGTATLNPAVGPGGTYADGGAVGGANYASGQSTQEDVVLTNGTVAFAVTKTNVVTTLVAGQTTSYTITYANVGPSSGNGATVSDLPVPGIDCTTVTCVSTAGGAACPTGLTLGVATATTAVPNFQNTTGLPVPTFPGNSSFVLRLQCNVTATGQ